jgi:hypothetical protein
MKTKLNKLSMMVVAAVMFASALFMSVERDQQGNWGLGALSAFASSESGGGESGGPGSLGCYTQTTSACWEILGVSFGDQHICIFNNVDAEPRQCGYIDCYGNEGIRRCVKP